VLALTKTIPSCMWPTHSLEPIHILIYIIAIVTTNTFVDKCSVAFTNFSAPTNVTCTSLFFLVRFWNHSLSFIVRGALPVCTGGIRVSNPNQALSREYLRSFVREGSRPSDRLESRYATISSLKSQNCAFRRNLQLHKNWSELWGFAF